MLRRHPLFNQREFVIEEEGDLLAGDSVRGTLGSGGIRVKDGEVVAPGLENISNGPDIMTPGRGGDGAEAGVLDNPVEAAGP